jgi:glycosyltransferase involved in cell wall biosynthesis
VATRLSVLIPVYNAPYDLAKSLASLAQATTPLDIVVVDDGSRPPLQLPEQIGRHRLILLRKQTNAGIEEALNTGLRYILRQGYEFVARLDAGDLCTPDRFAKQLNFLQHNPEVMLVGSHVEHLDTQGKSVFVQYVPLSTQAIRRQMHLNSSFVHPAVMIRCSAFHRLGLYSYNYPAAEDYELFFRFVKHYPVSNLNEVLTRKEINPNSISLTKRKKQLYSRLRIQLKYFEPAFKESYIGILKTLILYLTPYSLILRLKQFLGIFKKKMREQESL